MKKTVLRFGLMSGLVIFVLFLLSYLIFGSSTDYDTREVFGYAAIIISLLFVFFGIRHYRDKENGGLLSFGKGMKVGVLITLMPAIVFGLFSVIYAEFINPDFTETYYSHYLAELQKTMTPEKFEVARKEFESQKAMFDNPVFNFLLMFVTVFVIGVIVTVISSLILKRNAGNTRNAVA